MMMLGRTQQSVISASSAATSPYETGLRPQPYREISAVAIPVSGKLFKSLPARDKSLLWRVYLSLQLVKHPDLNQSQVRIILDAISLSSEFFAASNDATAKKIKANEALESLKRRAVGAYPHGEASTLFANVAIGKAEEDILKMYYDISALPLKKRKASFRNASAKNKSELWRTQLALFLARQPESNERQKDVILSAMSLATPAYFEMRSSDPAWNEKVLEPLRSLEEQIMSTFTLTDAAKIFAILGDGEESANSSRSVLLKNINYKPLNDSGPYKQWAHSRFAGQDFALEQSACQCSTASDYCPIWGYCRDGNCTPTESGCGTLWSYPCNGAACR
jgi:hypothetical protein